MAKAKKKTKRKAEVPRHRRADRFVVGQDRKGFAIYGHSCDEGVGYLAWIDPMSMDQARKALTRIRFPDQSGAIFELVPVEQKKR